MNRILLFLLLVFIVSSCKEDPIYLPKPRLFPKVEYPVKEYQKFAESYCDFTFEYPSYAYIEQEESFFNEKPIHPCWFDIVIPSLNGSIHCSYFEIKGKESFDKLIKDAFNLTGKHNIKADFRDEMLIEKPNDVSGIIFDVSGPVASPTQFYLTDSTKHFLRGALYFNNKVQPDSMAPVYEFLKEDIAKLIETFEWQ
jgi:gliding motility-associated lipoprotein GldD